MLLKNKNDYNKLDQLLCPTVNVLAYLVSLITKKGPQFYPNAYKCFEKFNFIPINYHYYNPVVKESMLPDNYENIEDPLLGIDLNLKGQFDLLDKFNYNSETEKFNIDPDKLNNQFYYHNNMYESGDAETLYNMVRFFKPKRFIEIGSGYSTLLVKSAIDKNISEGGHKTLLSCIEPFRNQWLETVGFEVIREPVEKIDLEFFKQLEENDILFIDSSHNIRTAGDVVYEYLRILPSLNKGVIVHFHDIFLPQDYPKKWIVDYKWFWTEQYLLQAFLIFNKSFKVLLSLNYLHLKFTDRLASKCPIYSIEREHRIPGAFWVQKIE